jgi:hypothetical protein
VGRLSAAWQKTALGAVRAFWSLLMLASLVFVANSAYINMLSGRDINGPFDLYSKQLYAFIRERTPANSVVIFMRPRALRLFTARDAFMTERCEDMSKADYIAIHEKAGNSGQIPLDQVTTCNPQLNLEEVFNNKRFTMYKITQNGKPPSP